MSPLKSAHSLFSPYYDEWELEPVMTLYSTVIWVGAISRTAIVIVKVKVVKLVNFYRQPLNSNLIFYCKVGTYTNEFGLTLLYLYL